MIQLHEPLSTRIINICKRGTQVSTLFYAVLRFLVHVVTCTCRACPAKTALRVIAGSHCLLH